MSEHKHEPVGKRINREAREKLATYGENQILRGARLYEWWNGQKRDPSGTRWRHLTPFEQVRFVEAAQRCFDPSDEDNQRAIRHALYVSGARSLTIEEVVQLSLVPRHEVLKWYSPGGEGDA